MRTRLRSDQHLLPASDTVGRLASQTTAVQRLLPVSSIRRTPSDCHKAAVGHRDRRQPEWQLYEVLRS